MVLTEEERVVVAEAVAAVDLREEVDMCNVPEDVADVDLLDSVLERSLASWASISCTRS